jgi:hypothetical protein
MLQAAQILNAFLRQRPSPEAVSASVAGLLSGAIRKIYAHCAFYAL